MHFLYKNTLIEIVSLRRVGQELVPEVMCIEVETINIGLQ
jgi:hypothetical protein